MPTSKDILKEAETTLEKNEVAAVAMKDVLDTAEADVAAFAKAQSTLKLSISSMKRTSEVLDGKVSELNGGLTTLRKNEAVMQAPADAKAYEKLVKDYTAAIKTAMEYSKKVDAQLKQSEKYI